MCDAVTGSSLSKQEMLEAGKRFMQCLNEADKDKNKTFSAEEFKQALTKVSATINAEMMTIIIECISSLIYMLYEIHASYL